MKKTIPVVGAILIKEKKILCAQRSPLTLLPLQWEFPGGKIEPGETPEEALIREIAEEMACPIYVDAFFDQTTYEYDFGIVQLNTFLCRLQKKEPILLEHHDAKWLSVSELETLDWAPADIPAVKKLQRVSFLQ